MSFYTLKQTGGYWAVRDPEGTPVYITAMNHVGDATIYPFDFDQKYSSKEEWIHQVRENLRAWGFTYLGPTIAGHSPKREQPTSVADRGLVVVTPEWPVEDFETLDYPFTLLLEFPGFHEMKPREQYPDVFSEEFRRALDAHLRPTCEALRDNPNLIGYHLAHNSPWSHIHLGVDADFGEWIRQIVGQPGSPARQKWIEVMRRLYGTTERYKEIYYPIESFDEIDDLPDPLRGIGSAEVVRQDQIAFIREVAREWYRLFHDTIRRYDPNHLILGDRLTIHRQVLPVYVLDAMYPYVDALSINMMGSAEQMMRNLREILIHWDKPILAADVGARAYDGRIKSGALLEDDEAVGQFYWEHVRLGVAHPLLIGIAWCGYWETTAHHSGIVDCRTEEVNQTILNAMIDANRWAQDEVAQQVQQYQAAETEPA